VNSDPASPPSKEGRFAGVLHAIGMPAPFFWGFIGVLLFMIGDGVESNFFSPFLISEGFTEQSAALSISAYGIFVTVGSWLAGTLSAIVGPRKVMLWGAVNWIIFEVLMLGVGVGLGQQWVIVASYAIRGIGYPFFAYAFLVWINAATPPHMRGSSVGWFWFVFGAGLPTLGSLLASATIPSFGERGTLWISAALVAGGGSLALIGVSDRRHAGPASNGAAMDEMIKGISILWRDPRVAVAAFVRLVNTTPNFALFVVAPLFFVNKVGFSQAQYLEIVTIVYTANIFANLFFGVVGDRFGWMRTVAWFGCVMSGVGLLLLYYVPLAVGPNMGLTILCWAIFGIGLAGFVPLTALTPTMVPDEDKGSALAIYSLAAGLSAFLGPALVGILGGSNHMTAIIWSFAGLYFVAAFACLALRSPLDPGQQGQKRG
jgi:polyol permease family